MPDPDPNASQSEPQPDAYQSASAPAPSPPASTPQQPVLPSVPVAHPKAVDHTPPAHVQPVVVAPVHAAVAPKVAPVVQTAPSRTATHIVVSAAVHTASATHAQRSRARAARATTHRQRHVVHRAHRAHRLTPFSFGRSAIALRWPAAFAPAATVEAARPTHVPPKVALAVAAVVLLSASFLAVVARQARDQVAR